MRAIGLGHIFAAQWAGIEERVDMWVEAKPETHDNFGLVVAQKVGIISGEPTPSASTA